MIAFVKGTVDQVLDDSVIIENNGIGYNIFTTTSVLSSLRSGSEVKLYTYLNVREDAMNLYGFSKTDDLKVFKLLITVSGIGPKAGLAILSVMTGIDLRYAVMAGDSKAISKAPGVGSKTAQKVILELKDKLKFEDVLLTEPDDSLGGMQNTTDLANNSDIINEAVMALAALGYSQTEAMRAVHKCEVGEDTTVEDLLKAALKHMF
jgi:Holliday junction DNA helicase RuvA